MDVISKRDALNTMVETWAAGGWSSGFVPTMGALHSGHLSLIEQARKDNDKVACSIFVNPLQFNNPDDLSTYPRSIDQDLKALEEKGCDLVFIPSEEEMYPEPVKEDIDLGILDRIMEGRHRPGHFKGVAIVVDRLFSLFRPARAYFGEKDFQQVMVIRELVRQRVHPVEVIACTTVREADGLAMSSRNLLLSEEQRAHAPYLYELLSEVRKHYPHKDAAWLAGWAYRMLEESPWFRPEYFEIRDEVTLEPVTGTGTGQQARAFVVAAMGNVRLIDNMGLSS